MQADHNFQADPNRPPLPSPDASALPVPSAPLSLGSAMVPGNSAGGRDERPRHTDASTETDGHQARSAGKKSTSATLARRPRRQNLPTLPKRQVTEAEKVSLATLETELGGRMKLVTSLSQAQLDKDGYRFLQIAADPANDSCSLAEICALANVQVAKVMAYVKAAVLARAHLVSSFTIAEHLPDVTRHVMLDAIPGERACPTCNGTSTVVPAATGEKPNPEPIACTSCKGTGAVPYVPDLAIRKTALTLGEMLGKPAGPGVSVKVTNTNLNAQFGSSTEAFDRMTAVTDGLLYGTGRDRVARREETDEAGEVVGAGEVIDATAEEATHE